MELVGIKKPGSSPSPHRRLEVDSVNDDIVSQSARERANEACGLAL